MSDDNRPPGPKHEGYFPIEWVSLHTGTKITFDCHLYLPKNGRMVHWLRSGSVFGPLHAEKLEKMGHSHVLIPDEQAAAYKSYVETFGKTKRETSFGKLEQQRESDLLHIKGTPLEKEPIRIFGNSVENETESPAKEKSFDAAPPAPAPPPKMKVDVDFINVAIAAIQTVFRSICKTELTFQPPTQRKMDAVAPFPVSIASFIDLNSGTIRGTVGLCFPALTYTNLLAAATGLSFAQLNENMALGAGEFMYHIFASARPNLAKIGYDIDRAVPFLVTGEDISVRHVLPESGFSFLINSPSGPFQFEVGIKTGG